MQPSNYISNPNEESSQIENNKRSSYGRQRFSPFLYLVSERPSVLLLHSLVSIAWILKFSKVTSSNVIHLCCLTDRSQSHSYSHLGHSTCLRQGAEPFFSTLLGL